MGDHASLHSGSLDTAEPVNVTPNLVVPIIVISVVAVAAAALLVLLCLQKKKKEEETASKRPTEDGVHEELIEANNNNAQTFASPDQVSELKQGIRNQPTRNPEHKKWYESKAIPFMDASVGSIPDAVEPAKV